MLSSLLLMVAWYVMFWYVMFWYVNILACSVLSRYVLARYVSYVLTRYVLIQYVLALYVLARPGGNVTLRSRFPFKQARLVTLTLTHACTSRRPSSCF